MKRPSTPQLVVIGTSAGLATGLLGVGGGIVIVPALVIWLGWQQREAQATSLGAVFFLASYGVIAFALAGRVDALRALLIGVPALFGVLLGTRLASRLPSDTLGLLFGAFQATIAILMFTR